MTISPEAADVLITAHDADMALVYIYYCKTGFADVENVAKGILMPRQKAAEALEKLQIAGLIGERPQNITEPEASSELPAASRAEVKRSEQCDEVFASLVKEAEQVMQRQATVPELQKLLQIYQYYNLAPETLMLLFHYVADRYAERYAGTRRPSLFAIDREANLWRSSGVTDLDSAEKYISDLQKKEEKESEIRDAIGIVGRDLTDTERQYIWAWIDMGFGSELIAAAYDKAVTAKRTYSPAYVNGILRNWKAKGIQTIADLSREERPKMQAKSKSYTSPAIDPAELMVIIEKMI